MSNTPRRRGPPVLAASLAVYVVLLILLALSPQPQEDVDPSAVMQPVVSEQWNVPCGVATVGDGWDVSAVNIDAAGLAMEGRGQSRLPPFIIPEPFTESLPNPTTPLTDSQKSWATEWIEQLASDADLDRQQAEMELLKLGHRAAPLLLEARRSGSEALRERIAVILSQFDQETPGYGLQITLSAERSRIKLGETLTLTTVITNTLTESQNLYLGHTFTRHSFESGQALCLYDLPRQSVSQPSFVGMNPCGTGAGPYFTLIAPGESVKFETRLAFANDRITRLPTAARMPRYWISDYVLIAQVDQVHRFFFHHTVNSLQNRIGDGTGIHGNVDPKANFWVGSLVSNGVAVHVTD